MLVVLCFRCAIAWFYCPINLLRPFAFISLIAAILGTAYYLVYLATTVCFRISHSLLFCIVYYLVYLATAVCLSYFAFVAILHGLLPSFLRYDSLPVVFSLDAILHCYYLFSRYDSLLVVFRLRGDFALLLPIWLPFHDSKLVVSRFRCLRFESLVAGRVSSRR